MAFQNVTTVARRVLVLVLFGAAAACGDRGSGTAVPPEVKEAQQIAARQACIGQQLANDADEQIRMLQSAGALDAAMVFAQAYDRHAQLQESALAQVDSAYNHSRTSEDSLQHVQRAAGFSTAAPSPGSVEANVARSYGERFSALFNDRDQPCNLRVEIADSASH